MEFKSSNPKTFFFYNQEWRREINGGSIFNLVPTTANYGFGSSGHTLTNAPNMTGLGTIYVPNTTDPAAIAKFAADGLTPGQAFPNDTIPVNLIDSNVAKPTSRPVISCRPTHRMAFTTFPRPTPTPTYHEEIARVDHQFNEKIHHIRQPDLRFAQSAGSDRRLDRKHVPHHRIA